MRRASAKAVLTACIVAASFAVAVPASADKVSDLQAEATRLEKKISALETRAATLAEQWKDATVQLDDLNAEVTTIQGKLATQSQEISALNASLAKFAISTYKYGDITTGLTTVLGTAGNAAGQRDGYSSLILGNAADVTDLMKAAREDTGKLEKQLIEKTKQQQKVAATLASKKAETEKADAEAKKLLSSTNVELKVEIERQRRITAEREAREFAERQRKLAEQTRATAAAPRTNSTPRVGATATVPRTVSGSNGGGNAATPATTVAKSRPARPAPPPPPPVSGAAGVAVAAAYSQIGVPYVFATARAGVSFDCSGLTSWAWAQAGISIPRTSQSQYHGLAKVPLDQIQPGDLIFYYSDLHHVSIYVGNGTVIHAPYSGQNVQLAPLRGQIVGAGRPG